MAAYQIMIEGELDKRWLVKLEGLDVFHAENGQTQIVGVFDQAALHGVLNRLRDLGIELISIQRIDSENIKEKNENTKQN
ncbi:MAG: hypothetical protein CVU42_07625 [Chloroflexi bacterium HGW-Chloroflexi-4]|nr:MAG: hypothetical protein CVU42_07625 [Chloroflexi bacterium HGW-Chloroflexi-4]